MPSSKARFLTWSFWLQIGLICIIINGILLYIITSFAIIPYLNRGGNLEDFGQMFHQKSFVHKVERPNPTFFCDTQSCSNRHNSDT